jgi:Asp-tRNA(Asn)/Glu-tRNA(Gln) amidotransferase A subunit family amidase
MKIRFGNWCLLGVLIGFGVSLSRAQSSATPVSKGGSNIAMDRDLMEVTIPQLEEFYRSHKYTVTQVVRWHLARIAKYNGIYRAMQNLDEEAALATAAREDAEAAAGGSRFVRGPLWGVPIVTKANTSIWVNMLGVPAVVVPGGFYPDGLPFGLEISARLWRDGDLLGWAYAYEQATKHRRAPVLVEKGLLPDAR